MAAIAFCALFAVPADAGGKKTSPIWVADAALEAAGTDALRTGDATGAIASLSELVARNPRDGARQALLALAYHIAARERPEAADLALTGYDLERLPRSPTRAVLSACETGRPAAVAGGEVLGLAATMLGIGVRSVVAPLLPISDEATVPIMARFHDGLRSGRPTADALQFLA